jgi:hypothetical protein
VKRERSRAEAVRNHAPTEKPSVTVRCFSALAPGPFPLTPDAQLRGEWLITYLRAARVMKLLMEGLFTSVYAPGKSL